MNYYILISIAEILALIGMLVTAIEGNLNLVILNGVLIIMWEIRNLTYELQQIRKRDLHDD